MTRIAGLIGDGYALYLERDHAGNCQALMTRGWLLRRRVRIPLDRQQFEQAKRLLGDTAKRRIRKFTR